MITVRLHSNETIVYVPYNRSDSILTIKKKLQQISDILVENQILFTSGHLTQDNVVMEEVINSNNRVIHMDLDVAVRGGNSIVPLYAPDMTSEESFQESNFYSSAPFYNMISKGLNFQGYCRNNDCLAFNKLVNVQLGMSKGNNGICIYAEVMFELICPACNEFIDHEGIRNVLFLDCSTRIKFKIFKGAKVEEFEITASSDKFVALKDPEKILKYHYIKFTLL